MIRISILIIAVIFGLTDDGSKKGRKGNERYRNEQHQQAAQLFSEGLQAYNTAKPDPVHSGLWNNLGASLYRLGDYPRAEEAFSNAVAIASSDRERARSAATPPS